MYRIEDQLLFSCLKNNGYLEIDSDYGALNWEYFLKRSREERIEPLIYNYLKEKEIWPAMLEEVRETLKRSYYRTAKDNITFAYELNHILESFSREGIDLILLKGIPMIEELYGNMALRFSSDMDLLIRPGDFNRAREVLEGLGFLNTPGHPEEFRKDNIEVDLHWHLTTVRVKSRIKAFSINMTNIWDRAVSVTIEGKEVKVPSHVDLLVYLSLHLSLHHGLEGLRWLVDISRLIKRYRKEIDWSGLVKEVRAARMSWPVYSPLYAAWRLLEVDIPKWVLAELKPRGFRFFERRLEKIFIGAESSEGTKFFLTLLSLPGLAKINLLAELLCPSKATLRSIYYVSPSKSIWPFYFVHWQRIISSLFPK